MVDNSPATFITPGTAARVAKEYCAKNNLRDVRVIYVMERGEIKGYGIRLHGVALTNDEVEAYV